AEAAGSEPCSGCLECGRTGIDGNGQITVVRQHLVGLDQAVRDLRYRARQEPIGKANALAGRRMRQEKTPISATKDPVAHILALTGLPAAMASRTASGSPSKREGKTNRSQLASTSGTSERCPRKTIRLPTPSSCA